MVFDTEQKNEILRGILSGSEAVWKTDNYKSHTWICPECKSPHWNMILGSESWQLYEHNCGMFLYKDVGDNLVFYKKSEEKEYMDGKFTSAVSPEERRER